MQHRRTNRKAIQNKTQSLSFWATRPHVDSYVLGALKGSLANGECAWGDSAASSTTDCTEIVLELLPSSGPADQADDVGLAEIGFQGAGVVADHGVGEAAAFVLA